MDPKQLQQSESLNEHIKRVKLNLLDRNGKNDNRTSSEEANPPAFSVDKQSSFLLSQRNAQANLGFNSMQADEISQPIDQLDANQNSLFQTDRNQPDENMEQTDFDLARITCAATKLPEQLSMTEDLLPIGEQLNESSNMSISSNDSDDSSRNIVLGQKLSQMFPNFFTGGQESEREPAKSIDDLVDDIQIPGILENHPRRTTSTSDNSNLISKIESLNQHSNQVFGQTDYDDDLPSVIDAEPFNEGDSFLDPDSLNQLDQEELNLLLSNASTIDIDLFLANDLLLEQELNSEEEEVQLIDQSSQKDKICEDNEVLMKFINQISNENGIDFKLTQRIIIEHLKGNTPVYITRYQIEDHKRIRRALVGKVVKEFNDLRRVYHFKNWKKAYALSKKNRFDQKASELFDQCLSYEKIALVYYLYYENTKCRTSNSKNDDGVDSLANDVYVNDDLSLRILNKEQKFDDSLKSKIPNHQNREDVLYKRMIKMIGHYLSKNEKLIKYLNMIRDDVRPTLIVKRADATGANRKFDRYLGEEIVIGKMSPVEILNLVYGEDLKQIKLEFNLSKIKEGAYQSLTRQYPKADDRILEDTFRYMWSFYFHTPLESYFRYEMKWKSKKLLEKDLQLKLQTLLYGVPHSSRITMLGIEPLGRLNSEGIQYAIKQNGMVILNDYFDLRGPKPFAEMFAELHRDYGFSIVVLPRVYFFAKIRYLINDVLMNQLVHAKGQIQLAEASKDNSLIETMSPQFRVEYYIDRYSDPLRQWIAYSNYMTLPDCEYFDLFKPYLDEILVEIFRDCVSLLAVDVNTEKASMLQYVNGLNRTLADEIVNHRQSNPFVNRRQIRQVKGMTDEIYHQAVGFLFIDLKTLRSKSNLDPEILYKLYDVYDATIIHPDMYQHADHVLSTFSIKKSELGMPNTIAKCKTLLADHNLDEILAYLKTNEEDSINPLSLKVIFHALIRPLMFDYRTNYLI